MQTDGVFIESIGTFFPAERVSAEQAVTEGRYDDFAIQYATGLTAAYVAGRLPALDMAVSAGRTAISRSAIEVADLDYHVHCSATAQGPEGSYPPGYVLRELGATEVAGTDVRHHSNGMLAAVEVAVGQLTGAAQATSVLITAGENFTSERFDRWRGFGTGFTVSDGAAAMVLRGDEGFAALRSINSGTLPELEQWHRGDASLVPYLDGWTTTTTLDRAVQFNTAVMPLDACIERVHAFELDIVHRSVVDAGINAADLAWVITANNDARMIELTKMRPLGLPMSRSSWAWGQDFGHMGACDVAVSLEHLVLEGLVKPGDHVLMTTSATGWVSSSAVVQILGLPGWQRDASTA